MILSGVKYSLAASLMIAAGLAAGCELGTGSTAVGISQDLWVANEMSQLDEQTPRRDDPLIFDSTTKTINLFAAAGQTVAFQIIIDADKTPPSGRTISFSKLDGMQATIEAKNIRTYQMQPISVTRYPPWYLRMSDKPVEPRSYYDVLGELPGNDGTFKLPPLRRTAIWVDLTIPANVRGGQYAGAMVAKIDGEKRLNLNVNVYDVSIPESAKLPAIGGFDHKAIISELMGHAPDELDDKSIAIMRRFVTIAGEHGIDAIPLELHPTMSFKGFFNWSDYDKFASPYITGDASGMGEKSPLWPVPFDQNWPSLQIAENPDVQFMNKYDQRVRSLLKESQEHLKSAFDGRRAFIWPYRGRIDSMAYRRHVALAQLARSACSDAFIMTHLPPNLPALTGWENPPEFVRLSDIIAPPAQWLDPTWADGVNRTTKSPSGVWLAMGTPPFLPNMGVISSPADARVIPWFAAKYNCRGLFISNLLNPSDESDSLGKANSLIHCINAPGQGIMPSIRLKRLRRGLQDAACLQLLARRGQTATANAFLGAMARYGCLAAIGSGYFDPRLDGWVKDQRTWDAASKLVMDELIVAVHPDDTAAKASLLKRQTEWRQLYDAASRIRVEQIRARIIPTSQNGTFSLTAKIEADLYNEFERDMDCVLKFDPLPEQWTSSQPMEAVSGFKGAARRLVKLQAATGQMFCTDHNGKVTFPLRLISGYVTAKPLAQAAFLAVPRMSSAPEIDANPADWPMQKSGIAGQFVNAGQPDEGQNRYATCQTQISVKHDTENIYILAKCLEPNIAGMLVHNDNIIRYEQLMACQEDIFEILLDPGLTATGPDDLYHIVVKPNAVVVCQKGIPCSPAIGKCVTWDGGVTVAVRKDSHFWIIEMAIPKSSFSKAGQSTAWGVNFARYNWQKQESSSWAGPSRYFYDPKNLGTMYLVPG